MRHIHLSNAQTVNACTLISIAVINAILSARDEQIMEAEIKRAHDESQRRYRENFAGLANGQGVLETVVYQRYYSNMFTNPVSQNVVVPVDNAAFADIIANRDNFLVDNGLELDLEFFTYNGELVEAIQRLAPTTEINWTTVTEEELRRLAKQDERLSLVEQFLRVITSLNSQGITLRMEGHTISLVQKENTYYSYDSLTGDLSVTQNPQEMAAHLAGKIATNRAREALIYYFSPLPSLKLDSNSPIKKEVPVEEQVPHQVEAVEPVGISAEGIHDLINNRAFFQDVGIWQQVNAELFTLIVSQLGVVLTPEEWALISAEQLCALLNIVPIDPQDVGPSSNISPFVTDKTGKKQTHLSTDNDSTKDLEIPISPVIKRIAPQVQAKDTQQPVQDSEKLIAIIDKLIENMSTQQNGRQTRRNSQWKADLLTDIKQVMQSTNPEAININQSIADIRTVCAKKRNILHFWAEPHSVSEFEKMLRDEEISTAQTNVLTR